MEQGIDWVQWFQVRHEELEQWCQKINIKKIIATSPPELVDEVLEKLLATFMYRSNQKSKE